MGVQGTGPIALGTCGAIVYLRDGLFEFLGINGWNWAGSGVL